MASPSQIELEQEVKDVGNRLLLSPPSSTDELLNLLDEVELILGKVDQAPAQSMQDALLPLMQALIADAVLRHTDMHVKISVASCTGEIIRITAPEAPYSDELMKEIFKLTVMALERLSEESSRCYDKARSILDTVANVRSCLVMLDLECDDLVVEMLKHFFRIIRPSHSAAVFSDMETIMTLVVDESEEITIELLSPFLTSLRKGNQNVSPLAWELGEKVLKKCAAKIKPYLQEAVDTGRVNLNDYDAVVTSVYQYNASENEALEADTVERDAIPPKGVDHVEGSSKSAMNDGGAEMKSNDGAEIRTDDAVDESNSLKTLECCQTKETDSRNVSPPKNSDSIEVDKSEKEVEVEAVREKRGRKPNSLIKPEEGYDNSWICGRRKAIGSPHHKKKCGKKTVASSSNVPASKDATPLSAPAEDVNPPVSLQETPPDVRVSVSPSDDAEIIEVSHPKRDQKKRKKSIVDEDGGLGVPSTRAKENSEDVILGKKLKKGSKTKLESNSSKSSAAKAEEEKGPVIGLKSDDGISGKIEMKQVSSAKQNDGKKGRKGIKISEKSVSEESAKKKKDELPITKLRSKDGSNVNDLTPRKEEDPDMPDLVKDYGEELVGDKIKVWWPIDQTFYEGAIHSFDPVSRRHTVLYADGDTEVLNLSKERWMLVEENNAPDQGQELHISSPPPALSDMPRTKKAKRETGPSAEREKADSLSRPIGGAAAGKSKVEASGASSKGRSTLDRPRTKKTKRVPGSSVEREIVALLSSGGADVDRSKVETSKAGTSSKDLSTLGRPRKKKTIREPGSSAEPEKDDLLSSGGGAAVGKSKVEDPKAGSSSKDLSTLDRPRTKMTKRVPGSSAEPEKADILSSGGGVAVGKSKVEDSKAGTSSKDLSTLDRPRAKKTKRVPGSSEEPEKADLLSSGGGAALAKSKAEDSKAGTRSIDLSTLDRPRVKKAKRVPGSSAEPEKADLLSSGGGAAVVKSKVEDSKAGTSSKDLAPLDRPRMKNTKSEKADFWSSGSAAGKSKVVASMTGNSSRYSPTLDENSRIVFDKVLGVTVDKLVDDVSMPPPDQLSAGGKISTEKSKIEKPKTIVKFKLNNTQVAKESKGEEGIKIEGESQSGDRIRQNIPKKNAVEMRGKGSSSTRVTNKKPQVDRIVID